MVGHGEGGGGSARGVRRESGWGEGGSSFQGAREDVGCVTWGGGGRRRVARKDRVEPLGGIAAADRDVAVQGLKTAVTVRGRGKRADNFMPGLGTQEVCVCVYVSDWGGGATGGGWGVWMACMEPGGGWWKRGGGAGPQDICMVRREGWARGGSGAGDRGGGGGGNSDGNPNERCDAGPL